MAKIKSDSIQLQNAAGTETQLATSSGKVTIDVGLDNDKRVDTFTAGENVVAGDVCYIKASDGKAWKAKGDADATARGLLVMALASISADASGLFMIRGIRTTTGLTAGDLWLSVATAGAILVSDTGPDATTNRRRRIGFNLSSTKQYFNGEQGAFDEVT